MAVLTNTMMQGTAAISDDAADAYKIENTEIVEELALPPVKIHCSVLAEDAIKAAIEDYRKKNDFY